MSQQPPQYPYGPQGQYPPYQQPHWQQGPSGYPPPPYQQPPPKKKKRRIWLWIAIGILVLIVLGSVGNHSSTQTATPPTTSDVPTTTSAPQATHAPATWKTVQSFTGNGNKETAVFSVPGTWRIVWTCAIDAGTGIAGVLYISVYSSDGSLVDSAVSATCNKKITTDNTVEHQAGNVYLDVIAGIPWKAEVQVSE